MYTADMPIYIRLKEVMDDRGIHAAQLARDTGITEAAISEWRRRKVKRIALETLDIFCVALHCEPGDLLERVAAPADKPRVRKPRKPRSPLLLVDPPAPYTAE